MVDATVSVRPTKRCLNDIGMPPPNLGERLNEINDSLVRAAQAIPELRDVGGAQRVVSLSDRVWFKVKTSNRRGIATQLTADELPDDMPQQLGSWWLCAAGHRQSDSPQHDFYEAVRRECQSGSAHLLPAEWDWKRLLAESAVAWRRNMKRLVIHLIARSLTSGQVVVAEFQTHRIKALVRADDGNEAYLAIIAEGIPNPEIYAQLLDCVPGIANEDWQPEPSPVASMDPAPGEIIWSTIFPSDVAGKIIELDEQHRE